ncbi:sialidase family protein [Amycolatopsis suaedae]|uniref:Exo-alpha-sialidase n=1 Tax=Amycolatopsis suaedae TaxID=2510978 RepID=A0A4V2EM88_9PSEU|nr:sialidase family protein [Amycolatopsis suaedae]RZQ64215.1 exo-alpha-sialidase [Amycolatopsis suaedae]
MLLRKTGATLLTCLLLAAGLAAPAGAVDTRVLLAGNNASYPRLLRLSHSGTARDGKIIASVNAEDGQGRYTPIFESTDEGKSFKQIGEIRDPEGAQGMCCGTLYELPRQVGRLRPGTLLWAASYGQDAGPNRRIALKLWASRTGGRSWYFLSEAARSHNHFGIWEPELVVDNAGVLWMHYADESESAVYAQLLNRVSSVDGVTWSTKQQTLAIPPWHVRPGMPIIRKLPDGRFLFLYEICNFTKHQCNPYYKISKDATNYGSTTAPGTEILMPNRNHFRHASTATIFPGGPLGNRVLLVGQVYVDDNGHPQPGNGKTLMANDNLLGGAPWYEVPAPVHINKARNHWCPNYSSTLLPVDDGKGILMLAGEFDGGVCKIYYGKGPA